MEQQLHQPLPKDTQRFRASQRFRQKPGYGVSAERSFKRVRAHVLLPPARPEHFTWRRGLVTWHELALECRARIAYASHVSSAAPHLVSEQEFLSLAESTDKLELLDGEVLLSPSPSFQHQTLLRKIVRALEDWAMTQSRLVSIGMAPLDVRFAPGRILQPDAFVLFKEIPRDHQGPIVDIPELCIEVLSSNRAYDRMTKRLVYGEAGVKELWTVSTGGAAERWCGERLNNCEDLGGVIRSPLLEGFEVAVG